MNGHLNHLLVILFVALIANPILAETGSIPQVDDSVSRFMEKYEIPGLSLAISRNGRLVYAKGYGFADIDAQEKVTPASRFRIASLSKPITAVAIFKLIEEGKLSLDTKVFGPSGLLGPKYGMANPNHPVTDITILHLLQHTSGGWPNMDGDPMFSNISLDADDLLVWTLRNKSLNNAPGSSYAYSNFGFFILGRVIEEITGMSYEEYVRSEILLPIGAVSMEIGNNTLAERKPGEVKYYPDNKYDPYRYNVVRMDANGGWIATATDLVRFLVHVDGFNSPPDILRRSTIRKMTEPSRHNTNYACGWSVNEYDNWWHVGLLPGTRALMVRGSGEFNWAILLNKRGPDGKEIEEDFDQIVWNAINDPGTRWPNIDLFQAASANFSDKPADANREVMLNVPHIKQDINMCVPASASAAIRYYGERQSPEKIKRLANSVATDRDFAGTYFVDLVNGIKKIGFDWEERYYQVSDQGFDHGLREIIQSLNEGKPVLVDTNIPPDGHTVLVIGYSDKTEQLILLDPNIRSPGIRRISYTEFKNGWHSLTANIRGAIFTKPKN